MFLHLNLNKVVLSIGLVAILISCKKEFNSPELNTKNLLDKKVKIVPACSFVLIPSGTRPRIGFLPDGRGPWGSLPDFSVLIFGVLNSNGSQAYDIQNPNLLGGLPADISGLRLTGLAVNRGSNYYNPEIILSTTRNGNHYLLFATLNGSNSYVINSQVIVSSPFAPASSGWSLHDIEVDSQNQILYGIFRSNTGVPGNFESKIASINFNSGLATLVKTYSNVAFSGMDFSGFGSYEPESEKMYLFREDINTSSSQFGQIIKLDLITLNETVTNLNISGQTNANVQTDIYNGFLVRRTQFWDRFYYYSGINPTQGGDGQIPLWSTSTNSIISTILQRSFLTLPTSLSNPLNIQLGAITDAAS